MTAVSWQAASLSAQELKLPQKMLAASLQTVASDLPDTAMVAMIVIVAEKASLASRVAHVARKVALLAKSRCSVLPEPLSEEGFATSSVAVLAALLTGIAVA